MQQSHALALTDSPIGYAAVAIFVLAYAFVVLEERLHLKKSKPVMLGAALIWALIGVYAAGRPGLDAHYAADAFRHVFLEFSELFFFLTVAMSFRLFKAFTRAYLKMVLLELGFVVFSPKSSWTTCPLRFFRKVLLA